MLCPLLILEWWLILRREITITLLFEGVTLVHLFRCRKDLNYSLIRFAILCEFVGNAYKLFITSPIHIMQLRCRLFRRNKFFFNPDEILVKWLLGLTILVHAALIVERFLYICSRNWARIATCYGALVCVACIACVVSPPVYMAVACIRTRYFGRVSDIREIMESDGPFLYHSGHGEDAACMFINGHLAIRTAEYVTPLMSITHTAFIILLLVFLRYFKRLSVPERRKTIGILIVEAVFWGLTSIHFTPGTVMRNIFDATQSIREYLPFQLLHGHQPCFFWVYVLAIDDVRTVFWTMIRGEKIYERISQFCEPKIRQIQGFFCCHRRTEQTELSIQRDDLTNAEKITCAQTVIPPDDNGTNVNQCLILE